MSADKEKSYLHVGEASSSDPACLHMGFKENPVMQRRIFEIIRDNYAHSSYLRSLATNWVDGWMHVADGRSMSVFGRCPEPDDILAMVLVRDGKLVDGAIQAMPTHRLLTINGIFQLPGEFERILMTEPK